MSRVIGIDLGTTNSVVSIMEGGEVKIIANAEGARTTPSVVAFAKNGEVLVGAVAKRQAVTNPTGTVSSSKRFIGKSLAEVKDAAKLMPYKVKSGKSGGVAFAIGGKEYSPEEIGAQVLGKLKKAAEDYLGEPVTEAVITVPAYFNDAQRQATKDAGRIAGLEVKRIIAEPTAAALAYGLEKTKKQEKIAVFDFGGGTFDISVLEVGDGVVEVLATNGDTLLGGDDIDDILTAAFTAAFKQESGIDVSTDPMAKQRLREAAEKAKIELSSAQSTDVNLPFLSATKDGPRHFNYPLSRSKFEQMISDVLARTMPPCQKVLKDSGLDIKDIDQVLLVGGSTRIPLVQKMVTDFFGKEPNKSLNPDEVVSAGASVQAAIITGEVKDVLLLDVTPLSLGIETLGGIMTRLIDRNTTIPTRKSQIFSTAADNQTQVEISVLQGEREVAAGNRQIARFGLVDIPPAPRGVPQIEVTFDIDANGIVSVSAKDLGTGKEQKVTAQASSRLSESEIKRMVDDAALNAEKDHEAREKAEARNILESLIFQTEKFNKENSAKVSAGDKKDLEAAVATAKKAAGPASETQQLKDAEASLSAALHSVVTKLYEKSGAQTGAQQGTGDSAGAEGAGHAGSSDEVIDAVYEEAK